MPAKKKSAPPAAAETDFAPAADEAYAPTAEATEPQVREEPGDRAPARVAPPAGLAAAVPSRDEEAAAAAYANLPESTRNLLETQFRARLLGLRELPAGRMR